MKNIYWCEELELILVEEIRDGRRILSGHRTKNWEDVEMNTIRIGGSFYDRVDAMETESGLLVLVLKEVK